MEQVHEGWPPPVVLDRSGESESRARRDCREDPQGRRPWHVGADRGCVVARRAGDGGRGGAVSACMAAEAPLYGSRAVRLQQHRLLSSAPLVALVEAEGGYAACAGMCQGNTPLARAWHRAKADGTVTWVAADVLAVKLLGLHPLLVWGEEWLRCCGSSPSGPTRRQSASDRKFPAAPVTIPRAKKIAVSVGRATWRTCRSKSSTT